MIRYGIEKGQWHRRLACAIAAQRLRLDAVGFLLKPAEKIMIFGSKRRVGTAHQDKLIPPLDSGGTGFQPVPHRPEACATKPFLEGKGGNL